MEYTYENIDELIAKVLSGDASSEELKALDNWSSLSEENKQYVEESKKLFATIDSLKSEITVDVNSAWEKVDSRIAKPLPGKVIPLFNKRNVFRAAASILLLATLAFLMYTVLYDQKSEPVVIAANRSVVRERLPDGSKVTINKNSEVSFVASKKGRQVKLKGEAYFEIKHDEKQPFEIVIDDIIVKDIGTAFNVKALPGSNVVEVLVEEGEVQFYTTNNKGVILKAGEKALYNKEEKTFSKVEIKSTENTASYRSKVFHFENTELDEVIRQINEVYDTQIILQNPGLGNCRLSVEFNNEELDLMLSVIAETLDLQVVQKGNQLLLKGEACAK